MNIVTSIADWQSIRKQFSNKTVGFIPTMGNLHEGHLRLCERSKYENEITAVSVYVNPTQFNQSDDFSKYPRTLEKDCELLQTQQIDYLFLPDTEALYPDGFQIQVCETNLSTTLEGEHRPGHFTGMLTVVLKLLNIIQPQRAYFGEKDYQQLLLIKKMVGALFLPVDIIACSTVRTATGLALSSRNSRLTEHGRKHAAHLFQLLQSSLSCAQVTAELETLGFKVDYVSEQWQRRLGAVWLEGVRLIDNV